MSDTRVSVHNGISLRKGAYDRPPPADQKYIIHDEDGVLKEYRSDGTKAELGGGITSPTPWFNNIADFAQGRVPSLITAMLADDCWTTTIQTELGVASGSGVVSQVTTKPGGVIRVASGTTANSFQLLRNKGALTTPMTPNIRTAKWAAFGRVLFVQTAATFNLICVSISDAATADTFVGAVQTASGVNYAFKIGTAAAIDSGVPFDTVSWKTLGLIADGTTVSAFLGDSNGENMVQLGTSQSQLTCPNTQGQLSSYAMNLGTAANVSFDIDKILILAESPTT